MIDTTRVPPDLSTAVDRPTGQDLVAGFDDDLEASSVEIDADR